ncbi:MAG: glycosyltransferase [Anaerolineae bacterium]|jgi:1,2-diacylglycerol 3-beta-galactosyltransferase|nr:glycosyltransferase [Anaerolineae bacterium]
MPKKVLFIMSDTGGGHRAAAEAIRDAMFEKYGADSIEAELLDVYRQMNYPGNKMPDFYPWVINNAQMGWALAYRLTDNPARSRLASRMTYRLNRARLRQMVLDHPADVVCCVHSLLGQPSMSAYQSFGQRPPWVTVVTDLVTTPYFWYDRRVDRCLVPSQEAYERGLECGLTPSQLRVTGLPVHPNFNRRLTDKATARRELGWNPDITTILMVAGGDGMGPMLETTEQILAKRPDVQVVVICGRNKALKEKIEAAGHRSVITYGFVTNMPQFMAAADVLVTKAGPATISEACIAGLPLILSGAIPGQEDGNVRLVVENDAGAFAPAPDKVAETVAQWLSDGKQALEERAERARKIARPDAVWEIAEEVWQAAHQSAVSIDRRAKM